MEKISVFEIFKIGIGPSSSHSMGPWNAANDFLVTLKNQGSFSDIKSLNIKLFGSLAKTGKGHGTDKAIMMGLMGFKVETFKSELLEKYVNQIIKEKKININREKEIPFDPLINITLNFGKKNLFHSNRIDFSASYHNNDQCTVTYYSVGGGFIEKKGKVEKIKDKSAIPYPIQKAEHIIKWSLSNKKSLAEISMENEMCWLDKEKIISSLDKIWETMLNSIFLGCQTGGELPGGLNVKRRAKLLNDSLLGDSIYSSKYEWINLIKNQNHELDVVTNWVSCFALAVNEVNASYGKIVTAPTNGAAGVIPAVLMYYLCFKKNKGRKDTREFLLVAGEIGMLFKKGATISAAAGGCQAEIGVSSAMAAAALAHVLGGTILQVLMAAEIAMEHHLGLSCDPIMGLVQVPCIERNTMGAMKAITAAQLALKSNPSDAKVSLDDVIKTMWKTGQDMMDKYKETSEGGLAVQVSINQPEC